MHPALTTALERISARNGRESRDGRTDREQRDGRENRERHGRTTLPPLYDTVDPEAVAALLESNAAIVRFEYDGYRIATGPRAHEVTVTDGDR